MTATPTPPAAGTVSAAYAVAVPERLRAEGRAAEAVLPMEELARVEGDAGETLPLARLVAWFEAGVRDTDTDFALRVGAHIQPRHYGVLGYVTQACATLAEAIDRLQRYERLVGQISRSLTYAEGDRVVVELRAPDDAPMPTVLAQSSLAGWAVYARWLGDRADLAWDADFRFPRPADDSRYRAIFGGRLRFGQPRNALSGPAHLLSMPLVRADAMLRELLEAQARDQLARIANAASLADAVRAQLHGLVPRGRATLATAAAGLSMSPRTLQRRLEEERVSFHSLLDEVRHAQALRHLSEPGMQLTEVAFLLGYADQTAFSRAFRRWTGVAPSAWRLRRP